MLTLYVDDLLITGPNDNTVAKFRNILVDKFTMTGFGDATQTLDIDIIQN